MMIIAFEQQPFSNAIQCNSIEKQHKMKQRKTEDIETASEQLWARKLEWSYFYTDCTQWKIVTEYSHETISLTVHIRVNFATLRYIPSMDRCIAIGFGSNDLNAIPERTNHWSRCISISLCFLDLPESRTNNWIDPSIVTEMLLHAIRVTFNTLKC